MDFFSLGEFSVYRINFFPLFFIAFRQRSCPCPWSSLGRRLAVLKKITGLQRVALTIKARAGEVREEATMTPEFFCSTDSTNFFLPQNFAGVGDGREVLQTESDSYFGNTSTFPSCDFAQRRYPVGYLSVTFSFLPIFPLLTEEIKSYSRLTIRHWQMSSHWCPYSREKKDFVMQSTWFVISCFSHDTSLQHLSYEKEIQLPLLDFSPASQMLFF